MNVTEDTLHIGIFTFHRVINYGALLQAYALQETIKKMGAECNIIDYRNPLLEQIHKERLISECRNVKDISRFIFYSQYQNKKFKKFREFSSKYLSLAHTSNNIEELRSISSQYDMFICGSDQVWNYKITNFDKAYFLDFCKDKSKKISYAASFGLDSIPEEYVKDYKTLLNNFSHMSVREWQGKKIIKELINKDAEVVLDPTMLNTKSEWERIAEDYKKKKNYILVYWYDHLSATMKIFLEKLSRQTDCEIVYISYALRKPVRATYEKITGPSDFLGLIKNARYVVTNSFHGTAFAIIFNKDFFLEMLPSSQGVNSRLENILDLFDLRKRLIKNGENKHVKEPIDYNKVNQILHIERQRSLVFLKKAIHI